MTCSRDGLVSVEMDLSGMVEISKVDELCDVCWGLVINLLLGSCLTNKVPVIL